MRKKSIFIFIYGYLPGVKYGGPVTSIYNLVECFHERYDFRIVCSNHEHGEKEVFPGIGEGWNRVNHANVCYLSESSYSKKTFYKLIKGFDVALFYLTGVFSYRLNHPAICISRELNIPAVIATRGEICKNALAMKSYKKLPYLWIMKQFHEFENVLFQVTSEEEYEQLIRYLNIHEDKIIMLPNLHSSIVSSNKRKKTASTLKLVFISRIHPKKNLLDAIRAVSSFDYPVEFDIYGPVEDVKYWEMCVNEMNKPNPYSIIRYCGNLKPSESKEIFAQYDAFLFPTLTENYGHVIVESLLSSCPVIISKGTTPWDDLDEVAGYVTELHNIEDMHKAMKRIAMMSNEEYQKLLVSLCNYRDAKLKIDKVIEGYERLFAIGEMTIR